MYFKVDIRLLLCTLSLLLGSQYNTPGANIQGLKERIRGLEERIALLGEIKKDGDARLAVSECVTSTAGAVWRVQ